MGAYLLIALLLFATPAAAAELCLTCHPSHYATVGGCTVCHRGNPLSVRRDVAHSGLVKGRFARFMLGSGDGTVREGTRLLEELACRRCHRIDGRGNRLAADLDRAARLKSPDRLADVIREPPTVMPRFELEEKGLDGVVTALLASAGRQREGAASAEVVHFQGESDGAGNVFSRKCGGCHRLLSAELGPLGSGSAGPNLTGLFSPFYPPSWRGGGLWTAQRLGAWLQNPRKIRPSSAMRPVPLTAGELHELVWLLTIPSRPEGSAAPATGGARKKL